jgi:hypothetical protein
MTRVMERRWTVPTFSSAQLLVPARNQSGARALKSALPSLPKTRRSQTSFAASLSGSEIASRTASRALRMNSRTGVLEISLSAVISRMERTRRFSKTFSTLTRTCGGT